VVAFGDERFPVLDVSDWPVAALEPGGTDEKVWLGVPDAKMKALFKPNRPRVGPGQGEDWPEKLASELATLLGLPAARIDLAERDGRRGCLSYDIVPARWELQPGAVLLNQFLDFQHDPRDKAARGHTLNNIQQVLRGYEPPPGFSGPPKFDAFSVFAGYLMLDALISNRDRHSENWAVLRGPAEADQYLAPSYDHASALGFNLSDQQRALHFQDPNMMDAFLRKGTAYRFEGCRKVTLVDHAYAALGLAGDAAREHWRSSLSRIDEEYFRLLVSRLPIMSEVTRRFAVHVLIINRRRLLRE
jgi:HipA-like C-terminal domain